MAPRTFIERIPNGPELPRALARWKRRRRQRWDLVVIVELATEDVIALGVLEPELELEPDRAGQYELELD